VWAILLLIAGIAGLLYAWGIANDPLEPYYEAAVRSMSLNWHNFFYGAFDPAGTITLDKLPGAFWIQAVSVRIFGDHVWAIVLPQVIAGVLTVIFLMRAVERLMGTAGGLIAAFVFAVASPATVALNRGNISDTEMVLLLVLAADATSKAIVTEDNVRSSLPGCGWDLRFRRRWSKPGSCSRRSGWRILSLGTTTGFAPCASSPLPSWLSSLCRSRG
jgi:4-amino-4-deoxy-L-arabinose transferase-like glycosyltransferase